MTQRQQSRHIANLRGFDIGKQGTGCRYHRPAEITHTVKAGHPIKRFERLPRGFGIKQAGGLWCQTHLRCQLIDWQITALWENQLGRVKPHQHCFKPVIRA